MHWHGSKALGWSQNHIGERTLLFVIPQKISSVRGRTCVAHHKRIKQISQRSPNMMRLYRPPQNVWHPRRGFPNVFLMALQRELSRSEDDRGPVGVYTCTTSGNGFRLGSAVWSESPCCAGQRDLVFPPSALTHSAANTELHLKLMVLLSPPHFLPSGSAKPTRETRTIILST